MGQPPKNTEGLAQGKQRKLYRSLRYGGFSFAVTVCFIIVVILLNAVMSSLGERYALRLDLTKDRIFQLSESSVRFLDELDRDVTIYVLTGEEYFSTGNQYYVQAQQVLRQYAARSPRVIVEYVDLPRNPGFEKRFPEFQLSSYTIILESGDNSSTVLINDLFNTDFDPYTYTEYITSSKAEQVLTTAIMGVTAENQVAVAMVEGFGESNLDTLESVLKSSNYKPLRQNILTEELDAEAGIAVVCAPMRDYTQDELQKLDRFLQNGGNYGKSLLYFASVLQPLTPNIDSFLADWGISVDDGIIYQTDYSRVLSLNHYWSAAEYTESVYAKTAIEKRLLTVLPEARPLSVLVESSAYLNVSVPMAFNNGVVAAPLEYDESWAPETAVRRGPIPAFILSQGAPYSQKRNVSSNVLVFASYEMISPSLMSSRTVGNSGYILNVISILSGHNETYYIAPKTIGTEELLVTGSMIITLGIVFVAGLPLLVLIMGGVMFFRRRHL
ncbi:MAG: GldG family protein [Peptococcaceae bacterium]|jgi:hypothetical protein|nr:GldG family protein [Peptococcaceae bacterium]